MIATNHLLASELFSSLILGNIFAFLSLIISKASDAVNPISRAFLAILCFYFGVAIALWYIFKITQRRFILLLAWICTGIIGSYILEGLLRIILPGWIEILIFELSTITTVMLLGRVPKLIKQIKQRILH